VVQEELAVPIVEVLHDPQPDLVQMALSVHPPRRFPRSLDRGKQQPDQERDERDHDQDLDEREAIATFREDLRKR
jgi:hypothetical protein